MQCLSCKNKTSNERCTNTSIKMFLFCGTHAKRKVIRHWILENPSLARALIKTQALWRGYAVRYRIKLAGPGCLKRSLCHNDDEVVTGDAKTDVSPFDYFSVVENDGKIWWFDQRSMIEWSQTSPQIRNPFTRNELSVEDARRLRHLYFLRKKGNIAVTHSIQLPATLEDMRDMRWLRVTQILHECGYADIIHHQHFVAMRYSELKIMLGSLVEQTRRWMYEKIGTKDPYFLQSKRAKFHVWCRSIHMTASSYSSVAHLCKDVGSLVLACLNDIKDPTDFSFFVITAYTKAVS
jgi:hypothetical protein